MPSIISCSIDLKKVNKAQIVEGKKGQKYYNFDLILNDEPDKFGNHASIVQKQSKEERAAKTPKVYLGNGKVVWSKAASATSAAPSQLPSEPNDEPSDLPF